MSALTIIVSDDVRQALSAAAPERELRIWLNDVRVWEFVRGCAGCITDTKTGTVVHIDTVPSIHDTSIHVRSERDREHCSGGYTHTADNLKELVVLVLHLLDHPHFIGEDESVHSLRNYERRCEVRAMLKAA